MYHIKLLISSLTTKNFKTVETSYTRASIILKSRYLIPFLYLLYKYVSITFKIIDF